MALCEHESLARDLVDADLTMVPLDLQFDVQKMKNSSKVMIFLVAPCCWWLRARWKGGRDEVVR